MKPLISIHKDSEGRHVVNVNHVISKGVGFFRNFYFKENGYPFDMVARHFFNELSERIFNMMLEKINLEEARERISGIEVKYNGFEYSFKDSPNIK